jgi:hypothetical protein
VALRAVGAIGAQILNGHAPIPLYAQRRRSAKADNRHGLKGLKGCIAPPAVGTPQYSPALPCEAPAVIRCCNSAASVRRLVPKPFKREARPRAERILWLWRFLSTARSLARQSVRPHCVSTTAVLPSTETYTQLFSAALHRQQSQRHYLGSMRERRQIRVDEHAAVLECSRRGRGGRRGRVCNGSGRRRRRWTVPSVGTGRALRTTVQLCSSARRPTPKRGPLRAAQRTTAMPLVRP